MNILILKKPVLMSPSLSVQLHNIAKAVKQMGGGGGVVVTTCLFLLIFSFLG